QQQRQHHSDYRQRQRHHDRDRLEETAELRGQHQIDEDHCHQQRAENRRVNFLLLADLPAYVEAKALRQFIGLDQRLDFLARVAGGSSLHVGKQRDASLQILAPDVLRIERSVKRRNGPERNHFWRTSGGV